MLGPIEIRGAARGFTRAWARELVVYLAMHPNGASNESWATALWPDRVMAPSSLHSTASVARRALGQTQDGRDHLPRSHGRLQLSSSVTTDWDRFVRLADSPDPEQWRSALELIRGRPFEGLRSTDWPILEGIGPAIEAAVVDLSGRSAGIYLGANRPQDARVGSSQGTAGEPLRRTAVPDASASGGPRRSSRRRRIGDGRADQTGSRRGRAVRFDPSRHGRSVPITQPAAEPGPGCAPRRRSLSARCPIPHFRSWVTSRARRGA